MECLLRALNDIVAKSVKLVLILILMECLLSFEFENMDNGAISGLNPYSNGMLT